MNNTYSLVITRYSHGYFGEIYATNSVSTKRIHITNDGFKEASHVRKAANKTAFIHGFAISSESAREII